MTNFAIIYQQKVENIVIGESVAAIELLLPDAVIVETGPENPCAVGEYFNDADGKFYIDSALTKPHGYIAPKGNSELYSEALAQLSAQYQQDTQILSSAYSLSSLTDGATQVAKQTSLQSQFASLKTQFASNLAAIKTQYGV